MFLEARLKENMMKRKTILSVNIVLIVLVAVITYFTRREMNDSSIVLQSQVAVVPTISRTTSSASWVSNAMTVSELVLESDMVVRVRVSEAPVTRVIRHELPVWDENNKIAGSTISETLFSDTVFEIMKIYHGEPLLNITVMQTGGFNPRIPSSIEEVIDDPLYKVGEEYVLFLVDISGDPVQATNRQLYRIVNPYGRYKIEDGKRVYSFGQNPKSDELPGVLDIHALEAQIEMAVKKLDK